MVYLITSIGLSAGIFLLFQLFERWRVDTFPAIVINYGVAAGLGWSLAGGMTTFKSVMHEPWAMVALCMGLLFIYLFQLIARSTQENGVTVTSIAAKLSMVLPVALFLLFDPNDTLNWQKGLAIALAIPAIVLASWKGTEKGRVAKWIVPLVIFFGSGMIDLMFAGFSGPEHMRQVEHRYLFACTAIGHRVFGWSDLVDVPSAPKRPMVHSQQTNLVRRDWTWRDQLRLLVFPPRDLRQDGGRSKRNHARQ